VTLPEQIPGLGPKTDRPCVIPNADLRNLQLSPVEGFVLSRVDGVSSYEQICLMSGVDSVQTLEILRRLKMEPVFGGAGEALGSRIGARAATGRAAQAATDATTLLERLDDGSPVDPADLVSGPDMTANTKMLILRLHRRLKKMQAHDILGLPPGADRNMVKRAYFAASKELHPDRYYGKDIGIFKEKLGDIFARLNEAFESLQGRDKSASGR
jgi:hypothetical protein